MLKDLILLGLVAVVALLVIDKAVKPIPFVDKSIAFVVGLPGLIWTKVKSIF